MERERERSVTFLFYFIFILYLFLFFQFVFFYDKTRLGVCMVFSFFPFSLKILSRQLFPFSVRNGSVCVCIYLCKRQNKEKSIKGFISTNTKIKKRNTPEAHDHYIIYILTKYKTRSSQLQKE